MSEKLKNLQSLALKCATIVVVAVSAGGKLAAAEGPAGTAFTYQGDLEERGTPLDGTVNFEFSLWDDPIDTDPEAWLGPMLYKAVYVEEGQFNVILDFGQDIFCGDVRWLEIAMCSPTPCRNFTTLTPRRELSPTAFALLPPGRNENLQGPRTTQGHPGPPVPPGLAFWALVGNNGTTPGTNFLGTTDNEALELHVNGERALRLEPNATSPNLIGGYEGNSVAVPDVVGATISGGGESGSTNRVLSNYGTVGGGSDNEVGNLAPKIPIPAEFATVGGGESNTASGARSTVAGGFNNTAGGIAGSTVGGGHNNTASGGTSTVAGGKQNNASGSSSTIGGGSTNTASLEWTTVAGGHLNIASGPKATIGGGDRNTANASQTTVGGGV